MNNTRYFFTSYFHKVFEERIGEELTSDLKAEIRANIAAMTPHKKIDNKGRPSEYFTFLICGKPVTLVCDGLTHKIITCVIETHHPIEFYNKYR